MIGTKCTPGLPAEPAETPHLRSMGIPATPDGRRAASFTRRYTDGWGCETTSTAVYCGADGSRFGFTLGREAAKVAVSAIEETHTGVDTIASSFEDETSDEPWPVIVEPD